MFLLDVVVPVAPIVLGVGVVYALIATAVAALITILILIWRKM